MDLSDYYARCPLTGLAFRVLAKRRGELLSRPSLMTRNPDAPRNLSTAHSHLIRSSRFRGPWMSVYCTWQAAMTRVENFINKEGATEVEILIIDLESSYRFDSKHRLEGVIDAYKVAKCRGLRNLDIYGYTRGPLEGLPKELLLPCYIPRCAIVACIPATGHAIDIPIHLGMLKVPKKLADLDNEDAIERYVEEEI